MIKHTVTLEKITQGKDVSYSLTGTKIDEATYLSILRQAKATKVEENGIYRAKNRAVGLRLVLSATGVPQSAIDAVKTSPAHTEEPTEAAVEDSTPNTQGVQPIAQEGEE